MNTKFMWSVAFVVFCGWLAPLCAANAGEVLLDAAGIISGEQSFVDSYDATSAGVLTVTLTDFGSPGPSQELTAWVTSANGALTPTFGPGTETVQIAPGLVSLHWVGDATGAFPVVAFGLNVQFQPGTVSTVPLPTSLLLLASGLVVLFFRQRGRREPALP